MHLKYYFFGVCFCIIHLLNKCRICS